MSANIECRTYWKDGQRVWRVEDVTIVADEPYYHLKLVQGKHVFAKHRVVDDTWFRCKHQVVHARFWRKVKKTHA